jgi:hypothetical protein
MTRVVLEPASTDLSDFRAFSLLCDVLAGLPSTGRKAADGAILSNPEIFARIVAFADRERVLPALHAAVAARGTSMPKACRVVLATQYEANRRRNGLIRQALLDLGSEGTLIGLEFAALKGAAWVIEDSAGCAAWRWMIDVDVLVEPARYDEVPRLLERMGYIRASDASRFQQNFHHAPYRHPHIPVTLEVHRHLGWRHRLLASEIVLASAHRVAPGVLLPVPWCRAFHAMIHWQMQDFGFSRNTTPVKDIVEVSRFLGRSDIDWPTLCSHARTAGATRACEAAAALASALLAAPVPDLVRVSERGRRHVERSLAHRASPLRAWFATQAWRAGTLWRCEKVAYRLALEGAAPATISAAVWASRVARLPLLAVRAMRIGVRGALLWLRRRRVHAR